MMMTTLLSASDKLIRSRGAWRIAAFVQQESALEQHCLRDGAII